MKLTITTTYRDTDLGLHDIIVNSKEFAKDYLKVGYPEGGKVAPPSQEGSQHEPFKEMNEVASVACVHEYGSKSRNISARPTLAPAIDHNKDEISNKIREVDGKVIDGSIKIQAAWRMLGEMIVSMIKQQILTKFEPELKPRTIKRKGFDKPLMDRLQMLNTVQYKVVKK